MFMLITQGGLAAGSVVWGAVGSRAGVDAAFLVAGLATLSTTVLGLAFSLPDQPVDLTPWNHWRMPAIVDGAAPRSGEGPVLVTVEYRVEPDHRPAFLDAMSRYGRIRRRDGASWWGIFRDLERSDVYVESFVVTSWSEHLRQHERLTRADTEVVRAVRRQAFGEPAVRHFIYAQREHG